MKAKNTLALIFILLLNTAIFAENFSMKEEACVNDIPFNTEKIAAEALAAVDSIALLLNSMPEECNVDDIPFDTHHIYVQTMAARAEKEQFSVTEEASVQDIPFNTLLIAARHLYRQALYTLMQPLKPIVVIRIEKVM